jgi:putative transposase
MRLFLLIFQHTYRFVFSFQCINAVCTIIWVSDIIYLRIADRFAYQSLITDAFLRKIVGYYLHNTLGTIGPLNVLKMAINDADLSSKQYLIHHSDRGLQYCSSDYITLLRNNFIAVSMTQNGDPYENAMAE